ncbi:MAG TPA: hypothetical protein PKH79_13000 [Prolixibacteraceae bacterium]|nr:hypothetical protein [Prolixibacteraceae bacterium]HPS12669.1 hypothetical protein [Prolixibacteraceae bacterium]
MKQKLNLKTVFILTLLIAGIFILSSCAQKEVVDACLTGHKYGFWAGLWHGIIAPIDFIVSLFNDKITMYAQNNNGAWYAFGFLIGSGGWGFLGGKGSSCKKSKSL